MKEKLTKKSHLALRSFFPNSAVQDLKTTCTTSSSTWVHWETALLGQVWSKFYFSGSFCEVPYSSPISPSRFSIFLFSLPFLSVLSFTVCWASGEDSVSLRLCRCGCGWVCVSAYVYTQRYGRVFIIGDSDISLFVCYFFLPAVCVFCYLRKTWIDPSEGRDLVAEVWRSLSPPFLHRIRLPQKQKYRT